MADYLSCGPGGNGLQTVAEAVVSQNVTKQDRIRERELFRFYRPRDAEDSGPGTPLSSPPNSLEPDSSAPISAKDVTLGALAQLVAYRLGVHRAMINVFGRETQYTLVESTKTLDLVDQSKSEDAGDGAWVGSGGSMHKNVSVCESVIKLPTNDSEHPFLIVPDLTKDERFKDRPYVAGPPGYRFYAGTQLRTARGVVIGALCVFAHQPRGISATEKEYMSTIADTIMQHLEMRRAAAERDKVTRMSRGLNAFVEGMTTQFGTRLEHSARPDAISPKASSKSPDHLLGGVKRSSQISPTADNPGTLQVPMPGAFPRDAQSPATSLLSQQQATESRASEASSSDKESGSTKSPIEEQVLETLSRAAGLLGEALGLRDGGGVVFYDTVARVDASMDDDDDDYIDSPTDVPNPDEWGNFSDGAITPGTFDGIVDSEEARAPVLGAVVTVRDDRVQPDDSYRKLTSRMLYKFLRRYPAGRTWEFDEHGAIPSPDEVAARQVTDSKIDAAEKELRQRLESDCLMSYFPGVRSLIFVPFWDPNLGRHYAGCFAWTTDAMGRFAADVEFSFVTAFGNSVSAEISRLATIDADQRKSDFIGSVSHELRSPLHGVLASSEFLADTELDSFQSTLVATIDSCGRTLLDTINHVLDYSKINSLRRTWKRNQKAQGGAKGKEQQMAAPYTAGTTILGSTDVAAITEEVVDSIYAGKVYAKSFSPADITEVNASGGINADHPPQSRLGGSTKSAVQVFLDISPADYHFFTQPGAIRRIIMNIFGNALKYTEKGYIIVKLYQQGPDERTPPIKEGTHRHKLILVVKDTGKGISSGYLRTRLFTPFAQENDLQPGTGLGLSIVRNIVTMLRGEIQVKSKVNQGTEVRIIFPNLARPVRSTDPGGNEPARNTLLDFDFLKQRQQGLVVGLYGSADADQMTKENGRILKQYLEEWCGAKCVTQWQSSERPHIMMVDEEQLERLDQDRDTDPTASIIVLCNNPSPNNSLTGHGSRYQFLMKPFGPYKLARTVRKCVEMATTPSTDEASVAGLPQFVSANPPSLPLEPNVALADTNNAKMASSRSESNQQFLEADEGARVSTPRPLQTALTPVGTKKIVPIQERLGIQPLQSLRLPVDIPERTSQVTAPTPSSQPSSEQSHGPSTVANLPTVSSPAHSQQSTTSRKPRVLVVDDNKTNLMLLLTFLKKKCDLPADSATDGAIAVESATRNSYDIIFMDISMPVMNGFEATREIRKHEENLRKQLKRRSRTLSSNVGQSARARSKSPSRQAPLRLTGIGSSSASNSSPAVSTPPSRGSDTVPMHIAMPSSSSTSSVDPAKPATPPVSPKDELGKGVNGLTEGSAAAAPTAAQKAQQLQKREAKEIKPALIIALTGLASGRDQSEAFTSGVDLYMTKPVSFKEVGKLIENWMENGGWVPEAS